MAELENIRLAKRLYRRLHGRRIRLFPRELRQRFRGSSVVNSVGIRIRIDPADARGRKVFDSGGAFDQDAVRIWQHIVVDFQPTLIIDVGANYGEIGLSCSYPPSTRLEFVEANPTVGRVLRRTLREVPRARLHICAAGDTSRRVKLHRMGAATSGLSSIREIPEAEDFVEIEMKRLDEIVDFRASDRVCFKVDVEGAELAVLAGMSDILEVCDWLGMVEFVHLDRSELSWLTDRYTVSAVRLNPFELIPFSPFDHDRNQGGETLAKDLVISPK